MTSGAVSLWVAGDEQAEPRRRPGREPRAHGQRPRRGLAACRARFDPAGPLRGALRPPPDKSISHRAALIAAMAEGESSIEGYLDSADTRSTLAAVEALGARVEGADGVAGRDPHRRGRAPGRRQRRDRRRQRRHPAAPAAGLARGAARRRLDARRRRVDPPPAGRPHRRAAAPDGRLALLPRGPPAAARGRGRAAAAASTTSCRSPAPRSSRACSSPGCSPRARPRVVEPLPSRDHTERMLAAAGADVRREDGAVSVSRPRSGSRRARSPCPPTSPRPPSSSSPRCSSPGSDVTLTGVGLNPTRTGLLAILERMGAEVEASVEGERGGEPAGSVASSGLAAARHRGRRRRGPAGDRRAAAGRARRLLRRGDDDDRATPPSCAARSRTGSRPSATPSTRSAPRSSRPTTAWSIEGTGGLRGGASTPTATTGSRCSARSPASPRGRASRSTAWTPPRSATRASRPTSRSLTGERPARRRGARRRARRSSSSTASIAVAELTWRPAAASWPNAGRLMHPRAVPDFGASPPLGAQRLRGARRRSSPSCSATAPIWSATPTAP